jgi:hypothetical protein
MIRDARQTRSVSALIPSITEMIIDGAVFVQRSHRYGDRLPIPSRKCVRKVRRNEWRSTSRKQNQTESSGQPDTCSPKVFVNPRDQESGLTRSEEIRLAGTWGELLQNFEVNPLPHGVNVCLDFELQRVGFSRRREFVNSHV